MAFALKKSFALVATFLTLSSTSFAASEVASKLQLEGTVASQLEIVSVDYAYQARKDNVLLGCSRFGINYNERKWKTVEGDLMVGKSSFSVVEKTELPSICDFTLYQVNLTVRLKDPSRHSVPVGAETARITLIYDRSTSPEDNAKKDLQLGEPLVVNCKLGSDERNRSLECKPRVTRGSTGSTLVTALMPLQPSNGGPGKTTVQFKWKSFDLFNDLREELSKP